LQGVLPVESLNEAESELYYDLVWLMAPSDAARTFFAERRRRGGGVGIDDAGELVRGLPGGAVVPLENVRGC